MVDKTDPRETTEWRRVKQRIKKRDQYRCQNCRHHEGDLPSLDLQVHHILPVKKGGGNDPENLISVCNRCHNRLHWNEDSNRRLTLDLVDDNPRSTLTKSVYRSMELTELDEDILDLLKSQGPTQLKDIASELGEQRQYVYNRLDSLKYGGYVTRISRGIYAYVTTLGYREARVQFNSGDGIAQTRIADPGTQTTIDRFPA